MSSKIVSSLELATTRRSDWLPTITYTIILPLREPENRRGFCSHSKELVSNNTTKTPWRANKFCQIKKGGLMGPPGVAGCLLPSNEQPTRLSASAGGGGVLASRR